MLEAVCGGTVTPSGFAPGPTSPTVKSDCDNGKEAYWEQIVPYLTAILEKGGAPYSTDQYVIGNGHQSDSAVSGLFVTNADDYAKQAGSLNGQAGFTIPDVTYGAYGGSSPGTWIDSDINSYTWLLNGFAKLSSSDSKTTVAGWLCTFASGATATTNCATDSGYTGYPGAGLEKAEKIFTLDQTLSTEFACSGCSNKLTVPCFVDGGMTRNNTPGVWCSGSSAWESDYGKLMNGSLTPDEVRGCNPSNKPPPADAWAPAIFIQNGGTADIGFYEGVTCKFSVSNELAYGNWGAGGEGKPQFASNPSTPHWPQLNWTKLPCPGPNGTTTADLVSNPAGIPTMCGADLKAWVQQMLPGLSR